MSADALRGARYAFIVANSEYEDRTLRRLRAPSRDADALARVLGAQEIGAFQVERSTNEPAHVLRRRLAAFFADRTTDDLLLVHLSGHGVKDEDGSLYFATSDTDSHQLDATGIAAEFLNRQMARSRSKSIVLFLDCCFSGAFARGALARGSATVDVKESFGGQGKIVLTSSNSAEYSFEGTDVEGEGKPSFFTRAIVEGLETGSADRDGDELIAVDELYDYVYDAVRRDTPNQTPCKWTFDVRGDIYLARNPTPLVAATAMLPDPLLQALESPMSSVRQGAIGDLAVFLRGRDRRMAAAARLALTALVEDDSRRVGEAARAALASPGGEDAPATDAGTPAMPAAAVLEPPAAAPEALPESDPAPVAAAVSSVAESPPRSSAPVVSAPVVGVKKDIAEAVSARPTPRPSAAARPPVHGWPAILWIAGAACVLIATFVPLAGNGSGTLASQPGAPFSYLVWYDLELFGVSAAAVALLVAARTGRIHARLAASAILGFAIATGVGGLGTIRFFAYPGHSGPGVSPAGALLVVAGTLLLAAAIGCLRSSPEPGIADAAGSTSTAAVTCIAGAVVMLAGLVAHVYPGGSILNRPFVPHYGWFGLEIIVSAAVVIAVSFRWLAGATPGAVSGAAVTAALGFQSLLFFVGVAGGWTTDTFGLGFLPGDLVGLAGAALVLAASVRLLAASGTAPPARP